jgi:surface carbohydrate biosynthesis protein
MKKKPLLILPIETKVRELDAKLLLALVALRNGFDVVTGALWELRFEMDLLDRGIYLDKSIAKTKRNWFAQCARNGFVNTALDEEGLVYFDAETYRHLRIYADSMAQVDRFFSWGEDQARVMAPEIGPMHDRIRVTGNPRFDLLRPELRDFYREEVQELELRFGRVILINTSFSFANSANDPANLQQTFAQYPIEKERPGFFQGWMDEQHRVMDSFRRMLPLVRYRFPEHTLIIRPHPSENLDFWKDIAGAMSETYVIRDRTVVPWILASEVLIHWNCTTAIEAYLLGVPAIAYREVRSDLYEQPLPNAVSFHAFSSDQLIGMLDLAIRRQLKDAHEATEHKKDIIQYHVSSLEGKLASEKIIRELITLSKTIERERSFSQKIIQAAKRRWRKILDQVDSSRHVRDKYAASKFPDMDADEIHNIISRLSSCLQYDFAVDVKELNRNCFQVSVKNP